jgi:hypothetical protein
MRGSAFVCSLTVETLDDFCGKETILETLSVYLVARVAMVRR